MGKSIRNEFANTYLHHFLDYTWISDFLKIEKDVRAIICYYLSQLMGFLPHACIVWIFESINTMCHIGKTSCIHVAVENILNSIPFAIKFNESVFCSKCRDMSHIFCGERPATYDTQ